MRPRAFDVHLFLGVDPVHDVAFADRRLAVRDDDPSGVDDPVARGGTFGGKVVVASGARVCVICGGHWVACLPGHGADSASSVLLGDDGDGVHHDSLEPPSRRIVGGHRPAVCGGGAGLLRGALATSRHSHPQLLDGSDAPLRRDDGGGVGTDSGRFGRRGLGGTAVAHQYCRDEW